MKSYTVEELALLLQYYATTLDNTDEIEWYASPQTFALYEVEAFIAWLKSKELQ